MLVAALCFVALAGLLLVRGTIIPENEVPLAHAPALLSAGDFVVVQAIGGQLDDMYGYQFKLDFDDSAFDFFSLESLVPGINLTFQRTFPEYLLVGATKVGGVPGYSSSSDENQISQIVFRAKRNVETLQFSLREVGIVRSDMTYFDDVPGWRFEIVK